MATSFARFAASVKSNAGQYATKTACKRMLTILARRYAASGSFGSVDYERREAIAAIQDRWQVLDGIERDARNENL